MLAAAVQIGEIQSKLPLVVMPDKWYNRTLETGILEFRETVSAEQYKSGSVSARTINGMPQQIADCTVIGMMQPSPG